MTDKPEQPDNSNQAAPSLGVSISRNSLLLGFFALICTAIIGGTHLATADDIAEQKRQAKLKALYEIIPRERIDNDLLQDNIAFEREQLGHRDSERLYLATADKKPIALIYPVTARDGYSGDIDLIIGVNVADNSVAGVRVLSHKETPGLGDKIELRKSNWILDFNGRSLGDPRAEEWTVSKDGGAFDAFTGATITPRAVTRAIAQVLEFHQQHGKDLVQKFLPKAKDVPTPAQ